MLSFITVPLDVKHPVDRDVMGIIISFSRAWFARRWDPGFPLLNNS